jgi:MFS family permease
LLVISGAAFESLAVATTLPAIIRELGGLNLYGWAFSAFMLANLLGITIAGAEADRDGPARPLALGGSIFILGLLIVGLAPAILVVIAGRAVQGFGAGMLSSVVYVSIGRGYPEALKPRMLAMTSTAWAGAGFSLASFHLCCWACLWHTLGCATWQMPIARRATGAQSVRRWRWRLA